MHADMRTHNCVAVRRQTMILPVMCSCVVLIIATVAVINVSIPQIETSSLSSLSSARPAEYIGTRTVLIAGLLFIH